MCSQNLDCALSYANHQSCKKLQLLEQVSPTGSMLTMPCVVNKDVDVDVEADVDVDDVGVDVDAVC